MAVPNSLVVYALTQAERAGPCTSQLIELMHLAKLLTKGNSPARLFVVTNGAHVAERMLQPPSVSGAAQGGAWGFGSTMRLEHPALSTAIVDVGNDGLSDVDSAEGYRTVAALVQASLVASARPAEPELACSHGERRVRRLARASLLLEARACDAIVPAGSALITGGKKSSRSNPNPNLNPGEWWCRCFHLKTELNRTELD